MYILLKVTHILPALLIGLIIGGAISGNSSLLIWSIVLLIADIIIGISLQNAIDNQNAKAKRTNWSDEHAEILCNLFLEKINQENKESADFDEELSDSDYIEDEYDTESEDVCVRFERAYSDLEELGGRVYTTFNKAISETYGAILPYVCSHIPHAPSHRTIIGYYEIYTSKINNYHAIVYTFLFHQNSICENVNIILVHQNGAVRLFAVETDFSRYVLCEYSGYRHINYGYVSLGDIELKISEILTDK